MEIRKLKHMNKKGLGLQPFVISIVLVVLFTFFIFTFVGLSLQEQNPNSEVLNEKYGLNKSITKMNTVITDFETATEGSRKQMEGDKPTAVDFIFLIFQGAFEIPKAFLSFVFIGFGSLSKVIFPAMGGTGLGRIISIVMTVIISIISITVTFLVVKMIRTGEGQR